MASFVHANSPLGVWGGVRAPVVVSTRDLAVDRLRGLAVVLMVLDHARSFFTFYSFDPEDLRRTHLTWFGLHWLGHLCDPIFVFLAGVSISYKNQTKVAISKDLMRRGVFLIAVEIFITNPSWGQSLFLGVSIQAVWALGVSMLVMAALIHLEKRLLLVASLLVICLHNHLDNFHGESWGSYRALWYFLHERRTLYGISYRLLIAYPVLPWVAVMSLGYTMASLMPIKHNEHSFFRLGWLCLVLFFGLRRYSSYGDPNVWILDMHHSSLYMLMSFFKLTKYPPSLLFLLMSLGVTFLLLSQMHRLRGQGAQVLTTLGRTSMVLYIVHIAWLHLCSKVWLLLHTGVWECWFEQDSLQLSHAPTNSMVVVLTYWAITLLFFYPWMRKLEQYKSQYQPWWKLYI
ncbi:MAG: heparan-alpha-glucosaminide N-acetyltransferase domain-containing protein [Zetaproteobacteria bacterium]|nr:heparan-alpha-glucosaminide N-acetyltransferase domain-containing protein [Zetaproteobacteria bacterium]